MHIVTGQVYKMYHIWDTIFYSDWISLEYHPVEFQASTEPTLGSTWHSLTGFSSDLNWDSSLAFMADGMCWAQGTLLGQSFVAARLLCQDSTWVSWESLISIDHKKMFKRFRFISIYLHLSVPRWYMTYMDNAPKMPCKPRLRLSFQQWREPNETKSGNPRVGQITWNQLGG